VPRGAGWCSSWATWTATPSYSGGGFYGPVVLATGADEWGSAEWKTAALSLAGHSGTVQLRFSLEVDQGIADKGWAIDGVRVTDGAPALTPRLFAPLIGRSMMADRALAKQGR
jgi:hypothetical protein